MLFSVGGLFSLNEGWHKLHAREEITRPFIALGVLAFGIVAESFSMWGCLREVNLVRGKRTLWQWFRGTRNAELVVIFGEDLAALVGLVLAFAAVLATWLTGNVMWDALGSIGIGVLLIVVAILLAVELKALLIGQGVEPEVRDEMVGFIERQPGVVKVLNLISVQLGNDAMVAVKARMDSATDADGMVAAINRAEVAFRQAFPQVVFLFFEPDVTDE
jgi:divalent metal cation (Fe/Co/Zn/Cd) transporter